MQFEVYCACESAPWLNIRRPGKIVCFSLDGSGAAASPSASEADSNQEGDSASRLRGNVLLHELSMLIVFGVNWYTCLVH